MQAQINNTRNRINSAATSNWKWVGIYVAAVVIALLVWLLSDWSVAKWTFFILAAPAAFYILILVASLLFLIPALFGLGSSSSGGGTSSGNTTTNGIKAFWSNFKWWILGIIAFLIFFSIYGDWRFFTYVHQGLTWSAMFTTMLLVAIFFTFLYYDKHYKWAKPVGILVAIFVVIGFLSAPTEKSTASKTQKSDSDFDILRPFTTSIREERENAYSSARKKLKGPDDELYATVTPTSNTLEKKMAHQDSSVMYADTFYLQQNDRRLIKVEKGYQPYFYFRNGGIVTKNDVIAVALDGSNNLGRLDYHTGYSYYMQSMVSDTFIVYYWKVQPQTAS